MSKPQSLEIGLTISDVVYMFGWPESTEVKQLRTKRVDIYKYFKRGHGFLLKVSFDNGRAAAWEDRR